MSPTLPTSIARRAPLIAMALLLAALLPVGSFGQSTFDHFATGFRLDGAHRFAECEACHTDGMFAGTPTECSACHTQASRVNATSKPPTHNITTDRCEGCHRAEAWAPVERIDHLEALGTCVSCHDGQRATGKPFNHVPAGDTCDDCHRTSSFVPAVFDHAGIVAGCASCHNGTTATGKSASHIPATNLCEDCHNTFSFSPVQRVEHLQVLGTCSSCHNGGIATGQHPQHIPTTEECDSCHNTTAW